MTMTRPNIIEFRHLTLSTTLNGRKVDVLRDLSFSVRPGKVLGLVGESGAGKSMLGRVIAGLVPEGFKVTDGEALFNGRDISNPPPREHRKLLGTQIAFIPQEPLSGLNPVLRIDQQIFEHLARLGIPRKQRKKYAIERLAEVHLPYPAAILGRYPHQLSGGQCQRVLIAMAFCGNPALIVADEPTTALDVVTQAQVMRVLAEQQARHDTAVILITHDLRLAAHVCDEVAVLYAGDMVERGPAAQVLDAPHHPYTRSLRAATPGLEGPRHGLPALRDFMPGLAQFADLPGCRFANRCPSRSSACAGSLAPLAEVSPGHSVRMAGSCVEPAAAQMNVEAPSLPTPLPDSAPLLSFNEVSLVYRGEGWLTRRPDYEAVKPLSFDLHPGEFLGIVGESGSGKSSVAKLIMGLEKPTTGLIRINGMDRNSADPRDQTTLRELVQMVFQDPDSALNPRRTVSRLVTQILESGANNALTMGLSRDEIARRLANEVGLPTDSLVRFPSQLSGGQKQRVNIARALCVSPRLLVADEIVSGLDVSVQALILNLLLRLARETGIALVFISHDLSVVRYLCSRVLVMHRGEVVEHGMTEAVFTKPQHPYTRLLLKAVPPEDGRTTWPPVVEPVAA